MDMEPFTAGLISLEDAQQKMLQQLTPISDSINVSLFEAAGRITARPINSPLDVPSFDNSAMDGYALRLADIAPDRVFPVAGKAFAGAPFNGAWPAGSVIRIMTGAPIPAGCDAVVMQEQTEQLPFHVWLKRCRGALGMTQKAFAHDLGYSVETYRNIEQGETISEPFTERLITYLRLPADQHATFRTFIRTNTHPDAWTVLAHIPVSYTHLTLPTILRV